MNPLVNIGCIFILLLISESAAFSVPSCTEVDNYLKPCLNNLKQNNPDQHCCSGLRRLKAMGKTRADRTVICDCVKKELSGTNYDPNGFSSLLRKCGIDYSLPVIGRNFTCSKIPLESSRYMLSKGSAASMEH